MVRTANFLLYQLGWFACVLGAAYGRPWIGIAIALLLVGVHFYLTTDPLRQAKLLLLALGVGLIVDTTLLNGGVFQFPHGMVVSWLPPLWMSVLWLQFATTFRYCLHWLSKQYAIGAVLGIVGAPLAFLGGEKLGAVEFLEPRLANLLLLAALWGLAIPALIYASDRIHRENVTPASYRGFGI